MIILKLIFDFIIYLIFLIFISIFKILPSKIKLKFSEFLGLLLYYLIPKGRKLSLRNLNLILNKQYNYNLTEMQIKDLIHDNFDDELEIVISADDCLDLNIKGCSKRGGVEYISQELKINPREIMAFGDSGNDYKMLKYVGHPVAMKDSFMSKRDFENKTDFTNDESGVAKYLQQYFNL